MKEGGIRTGAEKKREKEYSERIEQSWMWLVPSPRGWLGTDLEAAEPAQVPGNRACARAAPPGCVWVKDGPFSGGTCVVSACFCFQPHLH